MGPYYVDFTYAFDTNLIRLEMTESSAQDPSWIGLSKGGLPKQNVRIQETIPNGWTKGLQPNDIKQLFSGLNILIFD